MRHINRRTIGVITIAAGLAFAGVAAGVSGATPSAIDQSLLSLFETPNSHYPAVALTIGTEAISGSAFEVQVKVALTSAASHGISESRSQVEQDAVEKLRERYALVQAAQAAGVKVTDAEVTAYIASQENLAKQDPNQARVSAVMASHGDPSYTAYAADPTVREHYRELLEMQKLVAPLLADNPAFDLPSYARSLAAKVPVHMFFTFGSDTPLAGG
jgi:hypothetical protein